MASARGDSHDLRRQSVQGGAWAAAGAAGSALAGLVNFLILSRLLEPAAYGLMAMVESSLALAQRLMSSGLAEPLIQLPELTEEHSSTMFWTLQAVGIGCVAFSIAASGPIAAFFGAPGLEQLIMATSAMLYFQATSLVPSSLLARRFGFRETAQATAAGEIAGGAVAITMALAGYGVWSLVAHRIVNSACTCGVYSWKARWRPSWSWSGKALRSVWRYSASRGLEGILLFLDLHAPRVILGRMAGATELGYFIFARRLVENSVSLLNAPLRTAALSAFAAIQTDMPRVRRAYSEGISLTTSFMFPASVGIALVAPFLVHVLAGPNWHPAVPLLQLLILASIRQSFHIWNAALLRGLGSPQLLLGASFLRTISILLLIFLLLDHGSAGVAVAILAGSLASWPVAIWFVRKISGLGLIDQARPAQSAFRSTVVMAGAVFAVRSLVEGALPPLPALMACAVTGVLVYAGSMWILGRPEVEAIFRAVRVLRPGKQSAPESKA